MKSSGLFSAIGVLALCLLAIMLLNEWDGRLPMEEDKAKLAPLIIAENISGKTFTEQGFIEYELQAQELVEKDAENTTEFIRPDVHIFQQQKKPQWHITSQHAHYTGANSILTLTGEVLAQQLEETNFTIATESLTYYSKEELIRSPVPVRITQGPNITTAGGLKADAKTGLLDLFTPVESHYVAP